MAANLVQPASLKSSTYRRIQDNLRERIRKGAWTPGQMVPSRRSLAMEYDVSLPTIERAIADLVTDGTLRADGGRGTFVAEQVNAKGDTDFPEIQRRPPLGRQLKRTLSVGVLYCNDIRQDNGELKNYVKPIVLNAIEQVCSELGALTLLQNTAHMEQYERANVAGARVLLKEGVDVLITVHVDDRAEIADLLELCEPLGVPVVTAASAHHAYPAFSIYFDCHDAGYRAAEHLIAQGCRRILFYSPATAEWVRDRRAAAELGCRLIGRNKVSFQSHVEETDVCLVTREHSLSPLAYQRAVCLIESADAFDGIIAANDETAVGFLQAASEAGLVAGRDFALIGFDDSPNAREAGLSTMRLPHDALGKEAARLAFELGMGKTNHTSIGLHSQLIVRASSRLLSAQDDSIYKGH